MIIENLSTEQVYALHPGMQKDVNHLQVWLEKQKHLPAVTDLQLVTFLNSCNCSLEATKSCIDAYFTIKSNAPEFFSQRDILIEELQQISKVVHVTSLTGRSPEGYHYFFTRLADPDLAVYFPNPATKLFYMVADAALRHDVLAPGVVVISDMKGFTFSHMTKANITSLKKMLTYVQEAMPVRLKAYHVINVSPVIHSIMAFVKPFISKELLQMLQFHTAENVEEFYKSVPKKLLPKDYGGEDDSVEDLFAKSIRDVQSNREWFLEQEKLCTVNEAKREGKSRLGGDVFGGQQGSFKQLSID